MSIVTYQRGDTTALSKNFTRDEFECQCGKCTAQMIDTELVDKLQHIRDVLGVPLKITSGYRCIVHNASKTVGGSPNSKHRYGMAADWRTLNRTVNPVALGIIAQAVGFGGIGIYWHPKAAMCHADTRTGKATWLCTTPRKYPSTTYQKFILPTIRRGCTGRQTGRPRRCSSGCWD
ncbi:D-Ala-D-Ala carboxypeptidase family metallohydrolase [Faecalibacterium taiwanense]|uniref:D-Ala-D-Ala carboxypeptidase family metallohydrolase n=1 Tax=Faecalibacterium taiwanense TaxID=3030638 RepID=UPI0031FF41AB